MPTFVGMTVWASPAGQHCGLLVLYRPVPGATSRSARAIG